MGSLNLQRLDAHWDHEPDGKPILGALASRRRDSDGQHAGGDAGAPRFMESCVFLSDLLTAHEPLDWSAGLRPGEFRSSG